MKDPIQERYCLDCPRMPECSYGRIFEPDRLILAGRVHRGARDGLRGITIATQVRSEASDIGNDNFSIRRPFDNGRPLNVIPVEPGDELNVRLLQIGIEAIGLGPEVVNAMDASGKSRGLGPDHVRFDVDRSSISHQSSDLWVDSLPLQEVPGAVPSLKIHFDTPLFLKTKPIGTPSTGRTHRRFSYASDARPTAASIFRESLRTVRRAVNEYVSDDWALGADMRFLVQSADDLQTIAENLETYTQPRSSARQERRWQPIGWRGSLTIADVPLQLVPYLQWAGRLGVGDSRNCGAGLWRMELG